MTGDFPRQQALTRRFTLGGPRDLTVAPTGDRVVFLRTRSGTDPATGLWSLDRPDAAERLVVDPAQLGDNDADVPAAERTRRERSVDPVLDDQVDGLRAAAERYPFLDLDRVAIRGWSFGGTLAAAAVLRRPDVFHAAVAGAPALDQRLYDTHWQERFLGHPDENPEAYERSSLIRDAPGLRRPLLLVHGLADDNVLAAHTLRLSAALLAAGRPHAVLPLSGVTHVAGQVDVAANLLRLQLDFLQRALSSWP